MRREHSFEVCNREELTEQCASIVLAERITTLITSSPVLHSELHTDDSLRKTSLWFVSKGAETFAVDLTKLVLSETPLARCKGLLSAAHLMRLEQSRGTWPQGVWDYEVQPDGSWATVNVAVTGTTVPCAVAPAPFCRSLPEVRIDDLNERTALRGSSEIRVVVSTPTLPEGMLRSWWETPWCIDLPAELTAILPDFKFVGRIQRESEGVRMTVIGETNGEERGVSAVSDEMIEFTVNLGNIILSIGELVRLRKGVKITLGREGEPEKLPCTLRIGAEIFGAGVLCFNDDKVVLTVSEVV